MSAKVLATNTFWALVSHILSRGSLMLSAAILARNFDTSIFASYGYFQLTITMLSAYASMGMGIAASRYFAEFNQSSSKNGLLGTLLLLSIGISLISLIIMLFIPEEWLNSGLNIPKWILVLGVFIIALRITPASAVLGLEMFKESVLTSAGSSVILLMGVLLSLWKKNIELAMYGLILSELFLLIGYSWLVISKVSCSTLLGGMYVKSEDVKKIVGFSGPMFLTSFIPMTAVWLIGRMLLDLPDNQYAFSLFIIGMQWFSLALFLPGMLSRVLLPRIVREAQNKSGDQDSASALVKIGTLIAIGIAVLFFLVGVLLEPWLLGFYGDQYLSEKGFIVVFLAAAVFSSPANTIGNAIIVNNGQWTWFILTLVWVSVLLIIAAMMKMHGAWAGAWAYCVAYSVMTISATVIAKRRGLLV